nr:nuclear pore complex protein Nup98-Nup96-like [Dermacentor andersoni]
MATTSTRPLAVLAALVICIGWNQQFYARAQFVKGGGVKGSVKGGEGGSFRPFKDELGLGFSGNGDSKGFSSVKGSLGGTKGGAIMTKGGTSSFGSKGGFRSSSLSSSQSKGFSEFVKGGFGSSSIQQSQQSAGLKGTKGSIGSKGESMKGSRQSQELSQIKGIKGGLEGQLTKGFVKGASMSDSKQSRQSFELRGIKGGQDLLTKGSTKGGSLSSLLQGQQSSEVKGAKGSSSLTGISGSQFGTKEFAKSGAFSDLAQSQKQSSLGSTKGSDGLKGSLQSRFAERESFGSLQSGQKSTGTKGFKGGSGKWLVEQQTQKSRRLVKDGGAFGLGGNAEQSTSMKGSLKGIAGAGFRQKTQHSSLEHFGHQAHQARFSSSRVNGILRSVHFQGPTGQQKHHSQQTFSSHRWGSKHGFAASQQSFRHSGETGLLFGTQQQQSNKGTAFRQVGNSNLLQQSQKQISQREKNAESFQRGSAELAGQGQRLQKQAAGVSGFGSLSKGQQQRVGQASQSSSLSRIRNGQETAQQAIGQKRLSASSFSTARAVSGKSKLSLESGLVQDLSSAAASQQKGSKQQLQSNQAAMKRSFALGSLSSETQQKSMNGLLQQQQQQVQQQRRS